MDIGVSREAHIPESAIDHRYTPIWETVLLVPSGCVATYGQIAAEIGFPRHARMVGRAMRHQSTVFGTPPTWQFSLPHRPPASLLDRNPVRCGGDLAQR